MKRLVLSPWVMKREMKGMNTKCGRLKYIHYNIKLNSIISGKITLSKNSK